MRLLALDCDSRKIAIAVFTEGKLQGLITVEANKTLLANERSYQLYRGFGIVLGALKPDKVAIEQSLYSNNFASSRILSAVVAYCSLACAQHLVYHTTVLVQSWKKVVVGKGNATKEEVRQVIEGQYPRLREATQDQIDAVAIGEYYLTKDIKYGT